MIYFAGSIRGGREDVGLYHKLIEHMGSYGKVLTEHLGNANITASGEQLAANEVYERDVDWLDKADVMVAEISTPSLGVGYELCKAESRGIPVLCLYNGSRNEPSAMITGNKKFRIFKYEDIGIAFKEIDAFLLEH